MAAYPTIPQLDRSAHTLDDDVQVDRTVNGTVRVRGFYSSAKNAWTIKHYLTAADRDTLISFYNTNRMNAFDFTWSGDSTLYSNCMFGGPPKLDYKGAGIIERTVTILQQ